MALIEEGANARADWMLVMTDSAHDYQRAKASLFAEERKLIQLLSANPFLLEIQEARERILDRIENDDSTILRQELTCTFAINMVLTSSRQTAAVGLALSQVRDLDARCAPLRDEWHALLKLRNGPSD